MRIALSLAEAKDSAKIRRILIDVQYEQALGQYFRTDYLSLQMQLDLVDTEYSPEQ
jgi:hypothetical protein